MLEAVLPIPFWLEMAAALTGGLSGAMSAVRARYDMFGVAFIAIITGLAGGIMRDLLLRASRYNQHLTPRSMLLEVGTAGNSLEEALRSADIFSQVLADCLLGKA